MSSPDPLSPDPKSPRTRFDEVLVAALLMLAVFFLLLASGRMAEGHDQQNFLYGGRVVATGGTYYQDFVDPNFPAVVLLSALATSLARFLGSDPMTTWVRLTILLALGMSLAFLFPPRRRKDAPELEGNPSGAALAGISFLILTCLPDGQTFGQREHWVAALLLPLFDLLDTPALASLSWARALFVGAPLALAIHLKPQFGLVAAGAGLFLARQTDRGSFFRLTMASGAVFLGLAAAFSPWVSWQGFLDYSLQFGFQKYGDFSNPLLFSVVAALKVTLDLGWVVAVWLLLRQARPPSEAPARSGGGALLLGLCFGVGIAQRKGWAYHFLPASLLLTLWMTRSLLQDSRRRSGLALSTVLLLGGFGGLTWIERVASGMKLQGELQAQAKLALEGIPPGPVLSLWDGVPHPPYSPLYLERSAGSRYTWYGYLVASYRNPGGGHHRDHPPARIADAPPEERFHLEIMLREWKQSDPVAILAPSPGRAWLPFPPLELLETTQEFQTFFARYREISPQTGPNPCRRFLRRDLNPPGNLGTFGSEAK